MIGVFTQREASRRGAAAGRPVSDRHRHPHPQDVQAAGRQPAADRAGAGAHPPRSGGRRRAPTCARAVTAADEVLRDEDHLEIDALQRNIKSNFQQVVSLSPLLSDDLQALAANITDPGQAGRLHRVEPDDHRHAGQAGGARDARHPRAHGLAQPDPDQGARGPRARVEDPVAGAVRGRQEPARVLPARAAQGDPEGARRRRRPGQGDRRAARRRSTRPACRRRSGRKRCASSIGCRRCRSRRPNTPCRAPTSTGWSRCRGRSAPRTRSICKRTKEVLDADHSGLEKVKDRVIEYLAVRKLNPDVKGPILCFLGPPGVGKTSLAKSIANSLGPQVRARLARRHARRGGDPRPSPDLHRRAARADHPGPAPRRVEEPGVHPRRDRQARLRLPRRSRVGAARGARSRSRTTRSGTTTSTCRSICRRCCSSRPRTCMDPDSAGAARPHGSPRARRLHRGREAQDRASST